MTLPNVILGSQSNVPRVPLTFAPNDAKPRQANRQISAEPTPPVIAADSEAPLVGFLEPANSRPRLPVFSGALAAPIPKPVSSGTVVSGGADNGTPDETSLLIIGVDPSGPTSQLALSPGNRWSEFSISALGEGPRQPGGSPDRSASGGIGVGGVSGGASSGVGLGDRVGGNGNSGSTDPVSINRTAGGAEKSGGLDLGFAPNMVYPVPAAAEPVSNLRRNSFVVSAGPIGGGGLNVYRALNCEKIYTIFLPMPDTTWTMQYCQERSPTLGAKTDPRSTVVHLEQGLVPPDPDTESRFDFRRLPVPPQQAHKMIVLEGALREDGTVANLRVYQSIMPVMDEAARIAFSRWKFKPALREGKPVSVEILIGIPAAIATVPQVRVPY
jgi:hypothetical protein